MIGWFDWVIKDGKLSEGKSPSEWIMEPTTCSAKCPRQDIDHTPNLQALVSKYIGDVRNVEGIMGSLTWKATFSWYKQHFKFFSLSSEGLVPAGEDDFHDVHEFYQHFRVGTRVWSIAVPWEEGELPLTPGV